ncbi:hypothetical protein ADL01_30220 [Streptomyces sp. NRRL WC-3618]|uniref:hypothetical protein n=1 Tax=Streptomyces sp. NRRL WC-3618 TaxID=1519490 RepID=UPI0006AFEDFE|nr:hypothetical protein [Streptomyces sp. NRRL WC-3618]KOV62222.1 hypothetical protein ADL01_30220 [Streptomyces sp. NRRL WC-3618]
MTDDLPAWPTVHALLADGPTGCVRSALSDDPDQLQGFYEELSPDNLRPRFADVNPALARTEGVTVPDARPRLLPRRPQDPYPRRLR